MRNDWCPEQAIRALARNHRTSGGKHTGLVQQTTCRRPCSEHRVSTSGRRLMETSSQHEHCLTHARSVSESMPHQSSVANPMPQCSMLARGCGSRCCVIYVVRSTSGRVRSCMGNIEQHGARGRTIAAPTFWHLIARVANFFPSTVLIDAVEHWARARLARPRMQGRAWTTLAKATGLGTRTRVGMRLQGIRVVRVKRTVKLMWAWVVRVRIVDGVCTRCLLVCFSWLASGECVTRLIRTNP